MNTENSLETLWETLGAQADSTSVRRPNLGSVPATRSRSSLKTRLVASWLSGYIPLLLLFVCFSKGYLVAAAPLMAWLVLPLVAGRQGVTPARLLLMLIPVILVPPAYLHWLGYFHDMDPRAPMRNSYLTISYQEFGAGLVLLLVLCVVTYVVRERAPWFEQGSPVKGHTAGALLFIGLPIFILGAIAHARLESEALHSWESKVLQQDPYLAELRRSHYGFSPWVRLDRELSKPLEAWRGVETLRSHQEETLRGLEAQALRLFQLRTPPASSDHRSAEWVLEGLLRHHDQLAHPMSVLSHLELLRMKAGTPKHSTKLFEEHCRSRLESGQVSIAVLKAELSEIENLIAVCPTAIVQNDRRWYVEKTEWLRRPGRDTLVDLDVLRRDSARVHNIHWWLLVRPWVADGASLKELQTVRDTEVRRAASRLLYRDADVTHEEGAKPTWEFYALLYRLKIHQLENGDLPETLFDSRYRWVFS